MATLCTSAALTSFVQAQSNIVAVRSNWALIGLNACLIVLSALAVWVRTKSGEGFRLCRNVDGLWSPNAPLMASLCLGIYGALAITVLVLLASFAHGHARLGLVLTIFGLIPSLLFGWAWSHALGTIAHFNRLVAEGTGRRWASWSTRAFNAIEVAVPVAVVACTTVALPATLATWVNRTIDHARAAVALPADTSADDLNAAWAQAVGTCTAANRVYRSLWSIWAFIFLSVLVLYITYAILLASALTAKLHYLRPAPRPCPRYGGSWEQKVHHQGSSRSAGRPGAKNGAAAAMADRGQTQRVVRDLETTLLLGKWELVGFASYCLSWSGLSLYRAVRGLSLLRDLPAWGKVGDASLWVATGCAVVVLTCIVLRTRVILAAQERALSSVVAITSSGASWPTHKRNRSGGSGRPTSTIQVTVETTCKVHQDQASPECASLSTFGSASCGTVYLHEPARPEPALVRVRFPALGELDEGLDEDDEKGGYGQPFVVRQDSVNSTFTGAGWAAPAGWASPQVVGSPLSIWHPDDGADEIQVLSFGPLGARMPVSPLLLGGEQGSPEMDEKQV